MECSERAFKEFIDLCREVTNNDTEVLQVLQKRYNRTNQHFLWSQDFPKLIDHCSQKIKADSDNKYVYIKDFTSELNAYKAKPLKHLRDIKADGSQVRRAETASPHEPPSKKLKLKHENSASNGLDRRREEQKKEETYSRSSPCLIKLSSCTLIPLSQMFENPVTDRKDAVVPQVVSSDDKESSTDVKGNFEGEDDVNGSNIKNTIRRVKVDKIDELRLPQAQVIVERLPPLVTTEISDGKETTLPSTSSRTESVLDSDSDSDEPTSVGGTVCLSDSSDGVAKLPSCVDKRKSDEEEEGDRDAKAMQMRDSVTVEKSSRLQRQIQRLELLLEKLDKEIKKLQETELSLDDMDKDDSSYTLEERYKKRFVVVWKQLCELKGRDTTTGREVEKNLNYKGTKYPEVNRSISHFINKFHVFPDYSDIQDLINRCNRKYNLKLGKKTVDRLAREAFTDVGNILQRRRVNDYVENFGCHLTESARSRDDPALFDSRLRQKLDENSKISKTRLNEVINKYAQKQEEGSDNESEEEEEEEEEEKEDALEDFFDINGKESLQTSDAEAEEMMETEDKTLEVKGTDSSRADLSEDVCLLSDVSSSSGVSLDDSSVTFLPNGNSSPSPPAAIVSPSGQVINAETRMTDERVEATASDSNRSDVTSKSASEDCHLPLALCSPSSNNITSSKVTGTGPSSSSGEPASPSPPPLPSPSRNDVICLDDCLEPTPADENCNQWCSPTNSVLALVDRKKKAVKQNKACAAEPANQSTIGHGLEFLKPSSLQLRSVKLKAPPSSWLGDLVKSNSPQPLLTADSSDDDDAVVEIDSFPAPRDDTAPGKAVSKYAHPGPSTGRIFEIDDASGGDDDDDSECCIVTTVESHSISTVITERRGSKVTDQRSFEQETTSRKVIGQIVRLGGGKTQKTSPLKQKSSRFNQNQYQMFLSAQQRQVNQIRSNGSAYQQQFYQRQLLSMTKHSQVNQASQRQQMNHVDLQKKQQLLKQQLLKPSRMDHALQQSQANRQNQVTRSTIQKPPHQRPNRRNALLCQANPIQSGRLPSVPPLPQELKDLSDQIVSSIFKKQPKALPSSCDSDVIICDDSLPSEPTVITGKPADKNVLRQPSSCSRPQSGQRRQTTAAVAPQLLPKQSLREADSSASTEVIELD